MNKFKVGEKVIVVNLRGYMHAYPFKNGDSGIIDRVDLNVSHFSYLVYVERIARWGYFDDVELSLQRHKNEQLLFGFMYE